MQLTLLAASETVGWRDTTLPTTYALRALRPTDKAAVTELYYQLYSPEIIRSHHEAQQEIQDTFAGAYGHLLLALSSVVTQHDILVGTVLTVAQAPWPDTPAGLFIIDVMTHPAHRRQGVARAGVTWVAQQAVRFGHPTVSLRVESNNIGAVHLYHTLGFLVWTQ